MTLDLDKKIIITFLIYAMVGILIGLYHDDKPHSFDYVTKVLVMIPIAIFLFSYPVNASFLFSVAAVAAVIGDIFSIYNKFYLGTYRASSNLNLIFFAEICVLYFIFLFMWSQYFIKNKVI